MINGKSETMIISDKKDITTKTQIPVKSFCLGYLEMYAEFKNFFLVPFD